MSTPLNVEIIGELNGNQLMRKNKILFPYDVIILKKIKSDLISDYLFRKQLIRLH
jgi:hypothetical protein